jgi:hypothetical protein
MRTARLPFHPAQPAARTFGITQIGYRFVTSSGEPIGEPAGYGIHGGYGPSPEFVQPGGEGGK